MPPQPENEGDRKLLADVATYGWHVMNVLEAKDSPPFSYTIGLHHSYSHPELIILGLPDEVAHPTLNIAGEAIKTGKRYLVGELYDEFLESYKTTFRAVPLRQYPPYLGFARWFYDGDTFPALQLVYPDRFGRWPWNPEVSAGFLQAQPVLADAPVPGWASGAS
jgi:hypothetical protein